MNNRKHQTIATVLRRPLQTGFTLLEILVVIGLLSILALGMATMLEDNGDWHRAQETPKRWDAIRKAILGDGGLDSTGNPNLSGYVVDMGRLPQNIGELITLGGQPEWEYEPLYGKTSSVSCLATSVPDPDCYYLAGGWRGPYLYTAGSESYRDGWDNVDPNGAVDDVNFGWQVTPSGVMPNHTDLFVRSLGFGNELDASPPTDTYRTEYPENASLAMVGSNEWKNTLAPLQFNVQLNKPVTADINGLYLRVYYIDDATLIYQESSTTFNILNTQRTASVTITPDSDLPMGRYAVIIFCSDPDGKPIGNLEVFDDAAGTCNSNNDTVPFYFQLRPSTSIVNVQWNLS